MALPSFRSAKGLEFETPIESDAAPLHSLVAAMLEVTHSIRCLRDPTRGGLSSTLNEIAAQSRVGMVIEESAIPIREEVKGACELLGLDPLYVANEGKLVAIVAARGGRSASWRQCAAIHWARTLASSAKWSKRIPASSRCEPAWALPVLWTCSPATSCRGYARKGAR